jgi:hypothetical protein
VHRSVAHVRLIHLHHAARVRRAPPVTHPRRLAVAVRLAVAAQVVRRVVAVRVNPAPHAQAARLKPPINRSLQAVALPTTPQRTINLHRTPHQRPPRR